MELVHGTKYIWKKPEHDYAAIEPIVLNYSVSFAVAQLLVNRGYVTREKLEEFLFSVRERDVAHPALLKDASKAVDRIGVAIDKQEKILIAGDYDVDGITSSALLMISLLPLGARVNFFLPHRVRDGYGLSVETVEKAHRSGYTVIITVDNGISAFDAAKRAKELGIDLIITDHHRPHDHLPDAYAVVDPHQEGCEYPYKMFAGVGVGFKLMTLLYEKLGKELPPKVFELLLLGTVADVVPLTGENRYWVRYGLQFVNKNYSLALEVLKENAKVTKPVLSSLDIGFSIAPQINALGRLEDPRDGVKFLVGTEIDETVRVGKTLGALNEARKALERSVLADIELQISQGLINLETDFVVIASSSTWPPGVVGLVAGRLVGMYGRPAIVLHQTENGYVKGSCRSIAKFSILAALQSVQDVLETFGGHTVAAGLSMKAEHFAEFKRRINDYARKLLTPEDFKQKLCIDAQLTLGEANKKLIQDLAYLEPFGCENPQPLFLIENVSLTESPQLLKSLHVKAVFFADGEKRSVVFFNRPDLYEFLVRNSAETFDIVGNLSENHWNGNVFVEFQGLDIRVRTV